MKFNVAKLFKKAHRKNFFLMIFCTILLSSCNSFRSQPTLVEKQAFLMGTLVTVSIPESELSNPLENSENIFEAVFAELQRLEALCTIYGADQNTSNVTSAKTDIASNLRELNQMAGLKPAKVDPELFELIQKALDVCQKSNGALDISIGPLSILWGFSIPLEKITSNENLITQDYSYENKIPSLEEIEKAKELVDYKSISVDSEQQEIFLQKAGMKLDLGAVAKGYAVDCAIKILQNHGVERAIVNAGGNMRLLSCKAKQIPWSIGIRHPRDLENILGSIKVCDQAVVTSGDYERCFIINGKRYHHILNPKTGLPAEGTQSVTITGPEAFLADALSTAVFVLGVQGGSTAGKGFAFLKESFPEYEALLVDSEGKIHTSPNFAELNHLKLN